MNTLDSLLGLGLEPKDLGLGQVCLRGIVVFLVSLVMLRLADKRFMSKMTAFDVVLGFILASALARAINGSAPLFPSLAMGFVLVGLHRVLATLSARSERFGLLIKGRTDVLVENGKLNQAAMRSNKISENDLLEAARLHAEVQTLQDIRSAILERSGEISVIPAKS